MIIVIGGVDATPRIVLYSTETWEPLGTQDQVNARVQELIDQYGRPDQADCGYETWQGRFAQWLKRERGFFEVPWGFI